MKKKYFCTLLLLFVFIQMYAQHYDYPRDTSYSIRSAYLKLKKYHPEIEPISPQKLDGVEESYNVPYVNVGRDLTVDVFYPVRGEDKKYPGVLLIFGGGWSSGEKANQIPMAQHLAANGYVAVVAEYRLSPEVKYPAAVHDLKAAIRWMRAHAETYQLDTTKIATLGCSAGAQLATLLGVTGKMKKLEGNEGNLQHTSTVQAIVNIDGIVSFVHPEAEEGKYAAKWLGGYKSEIPEIWKEASPLEYAGSSTPPVLFINSAQPRFHAGRDDMIKILNSHSIYSEVHTIEGTPHSFWLVHPWFEPTLNFTVDFLNMVFK
ncbi:alpha/beta hydrolase [Fulvivirga kasyanovii]|uniref:Alpha/beta hydrolase n=1 Tax=Fulvivirga kasyanovii TaxID=396812 RepID=A0ABW9RX40_9BACT|nr:alpha/beta hydrolase [Fulvivirga kasyanovii]MTI28814.1 alpha/beta hydrolase [Fulvivirga kasyanovii]